MIGTDSNGKEPKLDSPAPVVSTFESGARKVDVAILGGVTSFVPLCNAVLLRVWPVTMVLS